MPKNAAERRRIYKKSVFDYGFLTLCFLIEYYIESEDYEECQMIKDVIEEINKEIGSKCPTEYGKEAIKYFNDNMLELCPKGKTPIDIDKRITEYAKKVIKLTS